jgi:hypothetical protein
MFQFILVYLLFASCMFAASEAESNNSTGIGLLIVSLLWPWFIVTTLFQKIIK